MKKFKTGLVMEGGAMRGLFTAGVIDVFMENKVEFDAAVGVSAGAAFGSNFKSRQIGRALRYNLRFCRDKRYCSLQSLIKTGDLFGAEFCYKTIPQKLDPFNFDEFERNPMKFYAVCTDMVSGKPVYFLCEKADERCFDIVRGSASLPLVSRPVKVDGFTLLDGGMSDSIPLEFMVNKGYSRNVVILTQPREYIKEKSSVLPLIRMSLRKYPDTVNAIENRHLVYNKQREYVFEKEKSGEAIVICPDAPLEIGRTEHNPANIRRVYRLGRKAAEEKLKEVIEFLNA